MENSDTLRIAGVVRESIVDGPGIRFAVFCQGCPHKCPGCHNEATHNFDGGYECQISRLVEEIDKDPLLQGVTFSGGEPLCQPEAFCSLAKEVKKRNLDIVLFTGFTYEELLEMKRKQDAVDELLSMTDYLVEGKFDLEQRDLTLAFRGSKNQRFIDMNRTRDCGKIVLIEN